MTVKIAINGLGRIGRCVVRAIYENNSNDIELVAINGRGPIESHHHLLKYDSVHGRFPGNIELKENSLVINGDDIRVYREREPENIPWIEHDVDVVLECTGVFKDQESAGKHIKAGAKKVIISAPSKDSKMVVYGVNENILEKDDNIISIGSCTTNCLAPVAKILNDTVGISKGFVTTIHAFTNDQNTTDSTHSDYRRARAASLSMIPTSTGAAKAIGKVIPELSGKLDGTAIRVPTPNVSMIDFCFVSDKGVNGEEINDILRKDLSGSLAEVLGISEEPLVSIDFNHNSYSSVFDTTATKVLQENFIRVAAWYDNEWGFSQRMIDVAKLLGKN